MFPKRSGLIVWVNDIKNAKNIEKFGNVLYSSKRLNYVVIYVNESEVEEKIKQLEKLQIVKKVERSYRNEINTTFSTKKFVKN